MDTKKRLQSLMEERGWSMYRMAKESNVAWTTIRNMFARNTEPSISTLEALCAGMGITLCQFFDESNTMGLTPEQSQVLQAWNRLSNQDKHLASELLASLAEKTGPEKQKAAV